MVATRAQRCMKNTPLAVALLPIHRRHNHNQPAKKCPKKHFPKSEQMLRTILHDGSIVQTPIAKRKGRVPGRLYEGHLHPFRLPAVPADMKSEEGLVYAYASDQSKFLDVVEVPTSAWIRRASNYVGGSLECLSSPLREYVEVVRNTYAHLLPDRVMCMDTKAQEDRDQWLLSGVSVARPQLLTKEQKCQARTAAFWANNPFVRPDVLQASLEVLEHYRQGGWQVDQLRLYKKTSKPSFQQFK